MAVTTTQAGAELANGDCIHNSVYTWANNQYGLMGMHFLVSVATPGFTAGDAAYYIQLALEPHLQDIIGIPALFLGSRCVKVFPVDTSVAGVATSDGIGGRGANLLPTQTCGILSFNTDVRGPAGRGRIYTAFPGDTAANAVTGLPNSSFIDDLQTVADILAADLLASSEDGLRIATLSPVIFHRGTNTTSYVRRGAGRHYWGTQKRRGDLGRPNPAVIPL